MKKFLSIIMSIFLILSTASGCAVIKKPLQNNLLYFGYFNADGWVDEQRNIDTIKDLANSNIVFSSVNERAQEDILYDAWKIQTPAILKISSTIFDMKEGMHLRTGWERLYNRAMQPLTKYKDFIFGLYIDHPFTNGLPKSELDLLINQIKSDFPNTKILLWENAENISGISEYAEKADIILPEIKNTFNTQIFSQIIDEIKDNEIWLKIQGTDFQTAYQSAANSMIKGIIISDVNTSIQNPDIYKSHVEIGQSIIQNNAVPKHESKAKYFGYYHADGFAQGESFLDEIGAMGNCNVAVLGCDISMEQSVKDSIKNGMLPIVNIHNLIKWKVDENGNNLLLDDWETTYKAFQQSIEQYKDLIFAFYVDEPCWNGIPENIFRFYTQRLRQDYPTIKMKATLAKPTLNTDCTAYFEYCTDLSYDTYCDFDFLERTNELERLAQIAAYGQDLWLIAWTCSLNDPSEETLINDLESNYILSQYENRVIGILGFTYASADDGKWMGDWGMGLNKLKESMPQLYQSHLDMGKSIIQNQENNR